ncbi:MAG TPA: 4-hydroxy-tetrahydrodipicolinate reductase [Ktedonobacterales bacterium]|nr:4-hydroxy-tetrahydrodipicolinate reductase [Ktedonobacterales bacterium]
MARLRVAVAGATGWVGRALIPAIMRDHELELVAAIARRGARRDIGLVVGVGPLGVLIDDAIGDALTHGRPQVLVDFTSPFVVMDHVRAALSSGIAVVVGTSGIREEQFQEIDQLAQEQGIGALVAGNFALTAVLMMKFAEMARRHIPDCEIIEYHGANKLDAPSGTALETIARLERVAQTGAPSAQPRPEMLGSSEARGVEMAGAQVHSVRLPGLVSHQEILFGRPGELLTLRHDSFAAESYVAGTLLAMKRVMGLRGLVRGLDALLEL